MVTNGHYYNKRQIYKTEKRFTNHNFYIIQLFGEKFT